MFERLALVPEDEAVPRGLSPRQLCTYVADLHGITDRRIVDWAIETVQMESAADRSMDGFSKGMRQRSKVAAALVKNPLVLVLDEPLNGADPVQRLRLIELFQRLGDEGRTVIVSSHVLHEVEAMAERVIVIVRGRLAAAGGHRAIRDAMDDVPRQLLVRAPGGRGLAAALVGARGRRRRAARRRRPHRVHHPGQGGRRAAAPGRPRPGRAPGGGAAPRRLAREPVPGAGAMNAIATRPSPAALAPRHRHLHPPLRAAGQALDRRAAPGGDGDPVRADRHHASTTRADYAFVGVAADSLFILVLPITALVIGDAVLGAEVRSGTFAFTWMSPVPTWQITVGRWLGGTIAAAGTIAVAFALSAVVAGAPELAGAAAVAGAFGAAAYVAVFIAIGCITKRAAVWSIAFVIMVEQLHRRRAQRHRAAQPALGVPRRVHRAQRHPTRPRAGGHPPRHRRPRPPRRHHRRRPPPRQLAPPHPQAHRQQRLTALTAAAKFSALRSAWTGSTSLGIERCRPYASVRLAAVPLPGSRRSSVRCALACRPAGRR